MQPISHYFIILSEHNIAEYRACLHLQPQNLHLVVTEWIAGQNTHTRFKNTLAQSGKFHGAIHEIGFQDHNKLIREPPKEIQNWLDTHNSLPHTPTLGKSCTTKHSNATATTST